MNVLLIDDEELELEQLEYILSPYLNNHSLFKARDASQALRIMSETNIHLALVDIRLPGKSGLELAEKLKEHDYTKVIIVTAFQSFEYAQRALRLKVDNFITKPIVEAELLKIVLPFIKETRYSELIVKCIDIIHEEYGTKITLTDIAKKIHVNHAYLSRKFNEEVGLSFPDFLNDYRIQAAQRMLQENLNESIGEVAEKCGFSGQHYFSSLFKRKIGKTPSEFKKEYHGQ